MPFAWKCAEWTISVTFCSLHPYYTVPSTTFAHKLVGVTQHCNCSLITTQSVNTWCENLWKSQLVSIFFRLTLIRCQFCFFPLPETHFIGLCETLVISTTYFRLCLFERPKTITLFCQWVIYLFWPMLQHVKQQSLSS